MKYYRADRGVISVSCPIMEHVESEIRPRSGKYALTPRVLMRLRKARVKPLFGPFALDKSDSDSP